MTLAEHLEELRKRLAVCLVAWLAATAVAFANAGRLIEWLERPAGGHLPRLAVFSPTEPLMAYLSVSVLAGLALAMPVILWQVWGFVRAGLSPRERAWGHAFVWWGSAQFAAGLCFAYFALLPLSLRFLLRIGREYFDPVISVERYLSFVTGLAFWCGLTFELPVVLWLLAAVGIVTPEWLRQQRPYATLIMVIVAALVTPTTDPVNLVLMTAPLVVLYELSILMARAAVRPRK
jgi:sec-independent protein translocase protein TatC